MKIRSIKRVTTNTPIPVYDIVNCSPYHNFEVRSSSSYIVSHNCNFSDEVNFGLTTDVEKLKKKYKQLISQIDARMRSRFLRGTYLPTMNIIASSKSSDQSFLDEYIANKKKNESKATLIVDEPQWVVDSRKDSKEHFYVGIGNKYLTNELLPLNPPKDLLEEYKARGYSILEVPIGYYENFQDNIDGALTDIAGISTSSSTKYISGIRWNEIKSDSYRNPFVNEIIEVGTNDDTQYGDYFDLSRVPRELKSRPMYIHLDMSMSGDKTGIAGVYVLGRKPKVDNDNSSKEIFYQLAFSVSVKAPKGYEVSFDKNRAFIRWLKNNHFIVKGVSADTFQSAQIKQQLIADKFDFETVSVDRVDQQTRQCLPYAYFKSTIYDKRLKVYKDCDFLTEEVLGLERESDGHIQHPDSGRTGSKDAIDAVCGSLWNAMQHADEIEFEYGTAVHLIDDLNDDNEYEKHTAEAIKNNFESSLKANQRRKLSDFDIQFGIAREFYDLNDDTIVW